MITVTEKSQPQADRSDPARLEKEIESGRSSRPPSLHHISDASSPPDGTQYTTSDGRIFLSEELALDRARQYPDENESIYLVYSAHDKDNPRNWPRWKKWYITCFVSMLNILTNPIYVISWLLLVIFQIPLALAPNIVTVIVCRLLQGFFGSAPLTNTGGTISDMWARNESGPAMAIYGLSSTFGPPLALVISGWIALDMGWRWLFWIYMAILGGVWILLVLTVPETRHSIILERKTKRLRKLLQSEGLAAASHIHDAHADEKRGLVSLFAITLTRPFKFLFTEPITMAAAVYNGFIYGIVYLFNEAFPLLFGPGGHNFNIGQWGAAFSGLCIGSIVAAFLHPVQERYYLRQVSKNDGKGVPEARMHLARFGTFLLPISLFWFAWTSFSTVHWIVPIIASAFFGAGIYIIILAVLNYVVDSYQTYAASALAGVILVRNLVGAGFPLFGTQMYERLGMEWAGSLLAFLSLPMCVIPFIFFYKGEYLRRRSPWAREHFAQDEDKPH
ncbi:hypothetical protein VM1G_07090 [Cytospora mali]|uniref:Major facilitator superfamily (MFS) profile domain-containing protein n=1 Tax=Cytospora mali TaxID=578113 RepID=A0A194W5C4_CYTMA|nr:hypothetical protein VM1G_07090 [Valsa mali]